MINGHLSQLLDEARQHWQHALSTGAAVKHSVLIVAQILNGSYVTVLLSAIFGLLGLVQLLFGLVLKAHKDRDDERLAELNAEILRIRNHVHALTATVGKVDQWQRFNDEDKK